MNRNECHIHVTEDTTTLEEESRQSHFRQTDETDRHADDVIDVEERQTTADMTAVFS